MKKLFSVVLVILLIFSFAGCDSFQTTSTVEYIIESSNQASTITTIISSTEDTSSKTTSSEPSQPVVQPVHTHKYVGKTTLEATCIVEGVKTYTCECGDSYTESLPTVFHTWNSWYTHTNWSNYFAEENRRKCSVCGEYESNSFYIRMFQHYSKIASLLGPFESIDNVPKENILDCICAFVYGVRDTNPDTLVMVENTEMKYINEFTQKCLGRTFDFTNVKDKSISLGGKCSYDKATDSLIWNTRFGADESYKPVVYVDFTTTDKIHFTATFKYTDEPMNSNELRSFTVELVNGYYIITSVK